MCPISPNRGFRPLILVRGAGYAIHKKGKLVTIRKDHPTSTEFTIFNSHFSNFMNEYHPTIYLRKARDDINPHCLLDATLNWELYIHYLI